MSINGTRFDPAAGFGDPPRRRRSTFYGPLAPAVAALKTARVAPTGVWRAWAVLGWMAVAATGAAAQLAPQPDPGDSQWVIPEDGIVRAGQGQRVMVATGAGEVVALLHAEVGDRRLVILPDGRLASVPTDEARRTEEPFEPATTDEIAQQLGERGFKDFQTRDSAHYVYVYNTSDEFYEGTRRILETMYPAILGYFKRLRLAVDGPRVPLVAVMFRTQREFQEYQQVPPTVTAYYNQISNQIVMYEQSELVEVAPELALKQAINTIAHEGTHQILHNIGVQQRLSRWPMWISEGLAEYFAPTTVGKRNRWKGIGKSNDLRIYELDRSMKAARKDGESEGEMLKHVVGAEQLTSSGYAAAWALTHYLASRQRKKFHDYLREVAAWGPLEPREGIAADNPEKLFAKYFGSDFAALEGKLVAHLRQLPYVDPIANQTHYVVLVDTTALRIAGVTTSPAGVRKWQEETLATVPPRLRAATRFRVVPFASQAQAEHYADRFLGRTSGR